MGRPDLSADWLSLLWGVELVPGEARGRGKLLRRLLLADDRDPPTAGARQVGLLTRF